MTSIVAAIGDLVADQLIGVDMWIVVAGCVGVGVVAYVFATITYRQ